MALFIHGDDEILPNTLHNHQGVRYQFDEILLLAVYLCEMNK
jgi:hypothetical protein